MRTAVILIAGAILAAVVSTFAGETPSGAPKAAVGSAAPDFALKDVYGHEFKLSDFKGRIVVLEWVNQNCPVSRGSHEKRQMQDTYKKYADKVIWLGIDTTRGMKPEADRVYTAQIGLTYPVLMDSDGKVGRLYEAKTTPHMFIIDAKGNLAYAGAIDDRGNTNYVAAAIDDLLAGRPVAKARTQPYGCSVKYP